MIGYLDKKVGKRTYGIRENWTKMATWLFILPQTILGGRV